MNIQEQDENLTKCSLHIVIVIIETAILLEVYLHAFKSNNYLPFIWTILAFIFIDFIVFAFIKLISKKEKLSLENENNNTLLHTVKKDTEYYLENKNCKMIFQDYGNDNYRIRIQNKLNLHCVSELYTFQTNKIVIMKQLWELVKKDFNDSVTYDGLMIWFHQKLESNEFDRIYINKMC